MTERFCCSGLGAQKATKNFAEIEKEAELADNLATAKKEEVVQTAEEKEASMVSLRLAYQDLEVQQKKKDQAMSRMDPKKAQQMERLGMGMKYFLTLKYFAAMKYFQDSAAGRGRPPLGSAPRRVTA